MYYLITKWFGTFLYKENKIIKKIVFKKNSLEISKILNKIKNNEILSQEKKFCENLDVIVCEKRLQNIGFYRPYDLFFRSITLDSDEYGFNIDLLIEATRIVVKKNIEIKLKSPDLQIIQMINALDDLQSISNQISERIESWRILDPEKQKIKPVENIHKIVKKEIKSLEEIIEIEMNLISPNIVDLIGPVIGARLISLAGGIKELGLLPSSTIQILGAEKAFFRFRKEGGDPPKHGIIYQHPFINKASKAKRGRISRLISSKISIAAKADAFTKRKISDRLKIELEKQLKKIRNN
jgi:nucleolar protein 56